MYKREKVLIKTVTWEGVIIAIVNVNKNMIKRVNYEKDQDKSILESSDIIIKLNQL